MDAVVKKDQPVKLHQRVMEKDMAVGRKHMQRNPVYVYKLSAGDFYVIGKGIWGGLDWSDGIELNEKGEPDYQFEWEGKRYSEEDFYEEIDKMFPLEEGVRPSKWYEGDEILELMSFGN